jgi:hypothetical protein
VLTGIPFALDLGHDEVTNDEQDGWYDLRGAEEGDTWAGNEPSSGDFGGDEPRMFIQR